MTDADAIVVGAGFGGLGAALTLAERGARVVLLEALTYPGGCASTFQKQGLRFEAGATLFDGFDEGQLFARWITDHRLDVTLERLDPIIHFRAPGIDLDISPDRETTLARLRALPGVPGAAVDAFFAEQRRVADLLWRCFDNPGLLPPFGPGAISAHLRRAPGLMGLLRYVGRPLSDVLARYGLLDVAPVVAWLDALCQITVQVGVREAEAPLALAALDFPFRGSRHVVGGIGRLAQAMAGAVTTLGGEVRYAERARAFRRDGERWIVSGRSGELRAPIVIANVLPHALPELCGVPLPRLERLTARVDESWGAVMCYLALDAATLLRDHPHHLQLVSDRDAPLREGNHLFVSVGDLQGELRTATVSTHLPLTLLRGKSPEEQAAVVARVQDRMRANLARLAPDVDRAIRVVHPASPRTFARFTRRPHGLVGGIPRRAGLQHYGDLWPAPVLPGLWLVGDSVFPGQSTLATSIGGRKTAESALAAS